MELIFWASALLIFYAYVGYPLSLLLVRLLASHPVNRSATTPSITLLIAAYNEEKHIGAKIENSLALNYPDDKLEILVVSDGSTDRMDEIVRGYAPRGVRLVRTPGRKGKTGAQNLAIGEARGDVVVFSDATTLYEKIALRRLVRNFADASVGGVEGRLVYVRADTGFMGNKDLLKTYEAWIKSMESEIWGGVGDNGAFYAIRRELCRPLREDLTSDFAGPLDVSRQGRRFVFEPEALCYEKVPAGSIDEFRRKIRTVRAGVNVFLGSVDLLNPLMHSWISYVLFGRKFCRWFSSLLLLLLLLANAFLLDAPFYRWTFAAQCCFYALAAAGILVGDASDRVRVVSVPKSFLLVNVAALRGIGSYLRSRNTEIWTPNRG